MFQAVCTNESPICYPMKDSFLENCIQMKMKMAFTELCWPLLLTGVQQSPVSIMQLPLWHLIQIKNRARGYVLRPAWLQPTTC